MRKIKSAYQKLQKSLTQPINKKILHKVGKQWLVLSASFLILLSGSTMAIHASRIKQPIKSNVQVARQANTLHQHIINNTSNSKMVAQHPRIVTASRYPKHSHKVHYYGFNSYIASMPHHKSHLILDKTGYNDIRYHHKIYDGQFSDFDIDNNYSVTPVRVEGRTKLGGYKLDKIYNPYNPSDEGYVFANEISHKKHRRLNFKKTQSKVINLLNTVNNSQMRSFHFSHNQISQVHKINHQFEHLVAHEDYATHTYSSRPNIKRGKVGKTSYWFRKSVINWVNFYRAQYGLTPVKDNAKLDKLAQYGADDCYVGGDIQHGLVGLHKPKSVSRKAWNIGKYSTNNSNLDEGNTVPGDIVDDYYYDSQPDNVPGHRAWILDKNVKEIGVGQDGDVNDLYVIPQSNIDSNYNNINSTLTFPNKKDASLVDVTSGGSWSLMLPSWYKQYSSTKGIHIKVHDNSTQRNVSVHNVNVNTGYGDYIMVDYMPTASKIKPDHKYTITISGLKHLGQSKNSYTYSTRIFNQF